MKSANPAMNTPHFNHRQTAHCESGVMSALLRHPGLDFNEAMVFGLASALSFAYIPLVKMAGMPLIAYRTLPKSIIRRTSRALGLRLQMQKFALKRAWPRSIGRWMKARWWGCKHRCIGCLIFLRKCVFISMRTIFWYMAAMVMII